MNQQKIHSYDISLQYFGCLMNRNGRIRIKFVNACYHVINRGNERKDIFLEEEDFQKFLELLKKTKEKYSLRIFAYCLMSNHFHLLLQTTKMNISEALQYLQFCYARYFNKRYVRTGHLFQSRFASILVDSNKYLHEVIRYIHRNPMLSEDIAAIYSYRWSSIKCYQGDEKLQSFVDSSFVMTTLAKKREDALEKFKTIMERKSEKYNPDKFIEKGVAGDKNFVRQVTGKEVLNISDVVKVLDKLIDRNLPEIVRRDVIIYMAYHKYNFDRQKIAGYFGVRNPSTISKAHKRIVDLANSLFGTCAGIRG